MSTDTTFCWRCAAEYPASSLQCPACCSANELIDTDSVSAESPASHDWRYFDDTVDHEFGRTLAFHWECERCGKSGGAGVGIDLKRTATYACQ